MGEDAAFNASILRFEGLCRFDVLKHVSGGKIEQGAACVKKSAMFGARYSDGGGGIVVARN